MDVAKEWSRRVARSTAPTMPARDLYAGRGFVLAGEVAGRAGADLYVVSAGMGLVRQDALLPPYELSVTRSEDCVLARSRGERFNAAEWWAALHAAERANPLGRLLRERPKALVVLALTRPYIAMIAADLAALSATQASRLRIVGAVRTSALPEHLGSSLMPYDERLDDSALGLQGTRFDFAARALSHFVGLVGADGQIQSPQDHARRVRLSLAKRQAPERKQRERLDGAGLRRHVDALRKAGESKSSALTRLRRDLGFACEQKRFSSAWESL